MACQYYCFKGGAFGDYWCNEQNSKVTEAHYKKYCRDYNFRECSYFKQSAAASSGCYLTTIVCNILKKRDDDEVLNTLRSFRNNILQRDTKYIDILKDYDNIGPVLAYSMLQDKDQEALANGLYKILSGIACKIEDRDYDKAITHYEVMTLSLINYYGLKHEYNKLRDKNYGLTCFDQSQAGHGAKQGDIVKSFKL